jgi:hypothetical protein
MLRGAPMRHAAAAPAAHAHHPDCVGFVAPFLVTARVAMIAGMLDPMLPGGSGGGHMGH